MDATIKYYIQKEIHVSLENKGQMCQKKISETFKILRWGRSPEVIKEQHILLNKNKILSTLWKQILSALCKQRICVTNNTMKD